MAQKNWQRMLALVVFFICVKLLFSVLIKDDDDDTASPLKFVYYWSDVPILIFSSFYFFTTIRKLNQQFFLKTMRLLLLMVSLIILASISSLSKGVELNTVITSQLKLFLPIYLLIVFNIFPTRNRPSPFIYGMVLLVFVISLYAFYFLEPSRNRDAFFWPVYFSGLHTHAYCVFGSYLMLHAYLLIFNGRIKMSWLITALFAMILGFGYGVRTSLFCLLAYIVFLNLENGLFSQLKKPFMKFFLTLVLVSFGLLLFDDFDLLSLDGFSSGRLSEYFSRIELIKNRGWLENGFGSGAGFDLMYSDTWWWEEKGSHNDYLTILIEFGLVYLILFLILLWRLFKIVCTNYFSKAIFFAYLLSSFLSNGYMFRPMAAYVLFLSVININVAFDFRKRSTNESID